MGCDIHLVLEVRGEDGSWIGQHDFPVFGPPSSIKAGAYIPGPEATDRSYARFGRLANVRKHGGRAPLGLPADASPLTRHLYGQWEGDAHSASWMPLDEALPIFVETAGLAEDGWESKYPCSYIFGVDLADIGRHRIVFWFDN